MTNGLKRRHYLFVPHDVVKAAKDTVEYAVDFTILPEKPRA